MRRFIHAILLTVVAVFAAAAQADFDEPVWTKFEPKHEEFTVSFPTAKISGVFREPGKQSLANYVAAHNKTFFAVFSDDYTDEFIFNAVKDLAVDGKAAAKDIEIDGQKAQRFDFKGADEFEHSFIRVDTPARRYLFHVIGESRDNPLIDEFLSSVHFGGLLPQPVKTGDRTEQPEPQKSASLDRSLAREFPRSGDGGRAFDPGGDPAKKPFEPIAPPKYTKVDSAVAITYKANPSYTDLARRYGITGMVRLRVTFEKNKEIGEITTLARLPLGLTQSAIRSARLIRFAPALRNGEPYTTQKIVEYNFNLY